MEEVLHYSSQTKTSLTRIMLDNMVVPLPNGDVDISMLKEAVQLINGRYETEVFTTKWIGPLRYTLERPNIVRPESCSEHCGLVS